MTQTTTTSDFDTDGPTLMRPRPIIGPPSLTEALRVPAGTVPHDHASRCADLWEAVLEETGLAAYDRVLLSKHATAAELLQLLRGEDLPPDSKLLAAIREAHPCT